MLNLIDIVDLVEKMRHAQREYFRTRSAAALDNSKRLEKQVDEWLKKFRGDDGQRELF